MFKVNYSLFNLFFLMLTMAVASTSSAAPIAVKSKAGCIALFADEDFPDDLGSRGTWTGGLQRRKGSRSCVLNEEK